MEWFDQAVEKARQRAKFRVAALRLGHPGEDQVALSRRLIAATSITTGIQ